MNLNIFKKKKTEKKVQEIIRETEKNIADIILDERSMKEKYGVDIFGNPIPELRLQYNSSGIEFMTIRKGKPYILTNVNELKTRISIWKLIEMLSENKMFSDGFKYLYSLWLMQEIIEAWYEEVNEIDITYLCNKQFWWTSPDESGTVIFSDIQKCIFETDDKVGITYLKIK